MDEKRKNIKIKEQLTRTQLNGKVMIWYAVCVSKTIRFGGNAMRLMVLAQELEMWSILVSVLPILQASANPPLATDNKQMQQKYTYAKLFTGFMQKAKNRRYRSIELFHLIQCLPICLPMLFVLPLIKLISLWLCEASNYKFLHFSLHTFVRQTHFELAEWLVSCEQDPILHNFVELNFS